jgi:hypothetical protein
MELLRDIHSGCGAEVFQPLLSFLSAKSSGKNVPPYIPKWDAMPLHKLCHLAHIWDEAGFKREAADLAHHLLLLQKFPTFWCPEKEFDEKKIEEAFSLLANIYRIEPQYSDPAGYTLLENGSISAALTLTGNGTSLGVIRFNEIEVRAMGPQAAGLSFGIQGKGMDGWTRTRALNEVWLEMKPVLKEKELQLKFNFVGLKPQTPLFLALYMKAKSCEIGGKSYLPKSLHRFNGETKDLSFEKKLHIECDIPHKTEIIPLAGEGCFWDAEFLVQFEISPNASQPTFTFKKKFLR